MLNVLLTINAIVYLCFSTGLVQSYTRIVGGKPVAITNVPYQLCVREKSGSFECGASIISSTWAVSAAHCFYKRYDPEDIVLASGATFDESDGKIHGVKQILNHPEYNGVVDDYDISALEVNEPFLVGSKTVQVIKMAISPPSDEAMAVVTGWGYSHPKGGNQLQKAYVPIIKQSKCKAFYADRNEITERMICAGYVEGGIDACQGDSGGPLVVDNVLVGIVSFGRGCARPFRPGVYARVDVLHNWVRNVTGITE